MSGSGHPLGRRGRIAAGVALSLAVHGALGWLLWRRPPAVRAAREQAPVQIVVVEQPAQTAPVVETSGEPARPTKRAGTHVRPARSVVVAPSISEAEETAPAVESHPLMRMRDGTINLTPTADTLARALGPVEAPPAEEKPRRKPRLPGTGLTTLIPEIDEKALQLVHPRAFEVLTKAERLFKPEKIRIADEVRGDLGAQATLKRWLFGSLANDPEALRNKVPTLACLVCVTLRPGVKPEVELTGPSGSPWFDRAAQDSLERAAIPERPDDALDPARACYRFSAKAWRTRPDLTNLAIPFRLNFHSDVRLISYQRI